MKNVVKYSKNSRVILCYNTQLHTITFYKYGVKNAIEIIIAPKNLSIKRADFMNYRKILLNKDGSIPSAFNEVTLNSFSLSNSLLKYSRANNNTAMSQTFNFKKNSTLTKYFLYKSNKNKPVLTVENYNGNKNLLFNITENKINNYIKILKNERR